MESTNLVDSDIEINMSYHDNEVEIKQSEPEDPDLAEPYELQNLGHYITDFAVTKGQDPENRILTGQGRSFKGSKGKINFSVGRKGSTKMADWWKSKFSKDESTFGHDPQELNFGIIGKLELMLQHKKNGSHEIFILEDIGLAQGHSGTSNNWWLAAKGARRVKTWGMDEAIACSGRNAAGRVLYFTFIRGGRIAPSLVDLTEISKDKPWERPQD